MALLQQIAGARQIVDPGAGLLSPRFVAVEPLAEGPKRQAGRLVDRAADARTRESRMRLMPFRNSWSAVGLSVCTGTRPRGGRRGHRFGGSDVLSVDVRHRCRLAIVSVVAEWLC